MVTSAILHFIPPACDPAVMMNLNDNLKQTIRDIHKRIGENLNNYQVRPQQNLLVAEIAKTLGGEYDRQNRLCVIEAGTGTGKSLAYCLGAIPLAMKHKLKVVISTATVALQEQLLSKDLPFFAKHAKLDVAFDIIKGRQRYACAGKLALFAEQDSSQEQGPGLFDSPPSTKTLQLLKRLYKAYASGKWDGDKDSWPTVIPDDAWRHVMGDKHSCSKALNEHRNCPFHVARERIEELDVLIVNHALLLADLELGGGKILSAPDETVYLLDEVHHLPQITRDFAAAQVTTKGAKEWLDKLPALSQSLAKTLTRSKAIGINLKVLDLVEEIGKALNDTYIHLQQNHQLLFGQENVKRFENGELPDALKLKAAELGPASGKLLGQLNQYQETLKAELAEGDLSPSIGEPLMSDLGFFIHRVENLSKLWLEWAYEKSEKATPSARWIETIKQPGKQHTDYLLATSPIEVGFFLKDKLWQECAGAVMCSATLTALGKFDFFRRQVGLEANDGTKYLKVDSPFDYFNKAELHVPKLTCEPSAPQFTDDLVDALPGLLEGVQASLVLFSSYWQMEAVADKLAHKYGAKLQVQGQSSRQLIIDQHKEAIDKGKTSIIFGTQSFSEGLDLPGKYLTNVIITKIPFAVPTSPVEEAHSEYIKARGGNPFLELSIPQASKKLVQAVGRLLRNEKDSGRVVILDRRLVSKQYGKSMLNALPPFKKVIEY